MSETPPNERMANRLDELKQITASTVTVDYRGGSVFVLTARDNRFWSDTYKALDRHEYEITKNLDGELFVEKAPADRNRRER